MLNLGCGMIYHNDWINVDFVKTGKDVLIHNLLKKLPFEDSSTDVVYHSHVLEHFTKDDGYRFLKECFRVLRSDGILRIAVPDLEVIARKYIEHLDLALQGNVEASDNYNWTVLEMYDQTVRNISGGEMKKYFEREHIPNIDYVRSRLGTIVDRYQSNYLNNVSKTATVNFKLKARRYIESIRKRVSFLDYYYEGRFRRKGEIHLWMYDRYSLSVILKEIGFTDINVVFAHKSKIANWEEYKILEIEDGKIRKPDSLFIECRKI